MNPKDRKILTGILEFAYKVKRRMSGVPLKEFLDNDDLQEAVLYALGQMGEKVNHLSENFKEAYPRREWYGLIGLRNRVFHSYEDISMETIFEAALRIDDVIELLCGLLE